LIASEDGREGSVKVHQDVSVFASVLDPNTSVLHPLSETRYGWLQVARGSLTLNDERLEQGDGVVIMGEKLLSVTALEQSEVLLFDLA
jgi:redox-sensitive bicupin YhaK (pirin superfamily)